MRRALFSLLTLLELGRISLLNFSESRFKFWQIQGLQLHGCSDFTSQQLLQKLNLANPNPTGLSPSLSHHDTTGFSHDDTTSFSTSDELLGE
jgi:hypothetical protein